MNKYIFFNNEGEIKAITASKDDIVNSEYSVAIFPFYEIEPFILGKKSTLHYIVKKEGEKFILDKKFADIIYTRTLDNYLTEIGDIEDTTIISITNRINSRKIVLEFSEKFKLLYTEGSDEDKNIINDILKSGNASIYLTRKHNPYFLLFNITFLPRELFEKGRIYIEYDDYIKNASAYAKRIISGYGYREIAR